MLEELEVKAAEYMPFLEDLHRRVYKAIILFCVLFVVGFLFTSFIIKHALLLLDVQGYTIAPTSPFQCADLAMDRGCFIASVIVFPYIAYTLFSFVSPGLTRKEKTKIFLAVPISVGLFITGFIYGVILFYYGLTFLAQVNISLGIANIWDISMFFSQIFLTASLLGILFEFPIILSFLIRLGVMDVTYLKKNRRIAMAAIVIFASLLPPTDGISLILMSVPLVGLYEMTLLLNNKKHYVWNRN